MNQRNQLAAAAAATAIVIAACVAPGAGGTPLVETQGGSLTALPTATTTTTTLGVPAGPAIAPGTTVCDLYDTEVVELGEVASEDVVEASGIVASRVNAATYWVINDSGNDSVLHAVGEDGADLAAIAVRGVFAFDWEDIAVGPGPEEGISYLYIGDIGDNLELRSTIALLRFPEPNLEANPVAVTEVETIRLSYPDSAEDSEAMWVDPITGDIFVVTKRQEDGRAVVYRTSAELLESAEPAPMTAIAEFEFGDKISVTAADITEDGAVVALRGYDEVWMWVRSDMTLVDTFAAEPCQAPSPDEVQGESLAFVRGGLAYVTVSEGKAKPINLVSPTAP